MDADSNGWTTFWLYGLLLIVLAAWAVHLFLAPSNWLEWTGAGLLQALIIAFYAEMYGFPLTISILRGTLAIDIPLAHSSGHLWAMLLGYGMFGIVLEMMLGAVFVAAGLLLIVKGWAKLRFPGDELSTEGVYNIVRHPQYAGIFLMIVGQLIHWPTIPTLLLAPVIMWLYVRLAKREEAHLIDRFAIQYRQYQEMVPMFVPGW
jgi:protein-S-isoprenylcysteine O-methyltransferase Ste14